MVELKNDEFDPILQNRISDTCEWCFSDELNRFNPQLRLSILIDPWKLYC